MKTLAELQAMRDDMKSQVGVRRDSNYRMRIVVGMATCGIAAGARPRSHGPAPKRLQSANLTTL